MAKTRDALKILDRMIGDDADMRQMIAEETLKTIEGDMEGKKGLFSVFSERMVAIRGTAQQLSLPHVANIAGLAEEIAAASGLKVEVMDEMRADELGLARMVLGAQSPQRGVVGLRQNRPGHAEEHQP